MPGGTAVAENSRECMPLWIALYSAAMLAPVAYPTTLIPPQGCEACPKRKDPGHDSVESDCKIRNLSPESLKPILATLP